MPSSATLPSRLGPAVFIALVLLGYRQSVPRTIKPAMLAAVALAMFGFSLYGIVSAFGPSRWPCYCGQRATPPSWCSARGIWRLAAARAGTSVRIPGS
ncbi:MAG: hypothetical protein U1F67_07880 [Rubrivivax sp.]